MDPAKILLVNPNAMRPVIAPVGLDYLGRALEADGFEVELLDLALEPDPESALARIGSGYALIGLTVRNVDDSHCESGEFLLRKITPAAEALKRTGCPIAAGGVGFSIFPVPVLEYLGLQFGIVGDGETALPGLARALRDRTGLDAVPGLVFKEQGRWRMNPAEYADLGGLRLSGRRLVDLESYIKLGGQVGFETARGCDRSCVYCPEPMIRGRKLRFRDPADAALELERMADRGVDAFHTCDSEFNLDPEHARAVCRAVIHRGLGDRIAWYAYCTPDGFDAGLAELMRRAGCVGVDFGVDHVLDPMLERLGRRHRAADIERLTGILKEFDFAYMYDLLLGSPGETRETISRALEFMRGIDAMLVGVGLGVRVYPGTEFHRRLWGAGSGGDMLEPVFYREPGLGADIDAHVRELIGGDKRFLKADPAADRDSNYNYNDNSALVAAIEGGMRGAFWDILRRMDRG